MTITLRIILIVTSLFSCFLCVKKIKQSKLLPKEIENDEKIITKEEIIKKK